MADIKTQMLDLLALPLDDDVQFEIDDLVHDVAAQDRTLAEDRDERSQWASDINNQGPEEQIGYLLDSGMKDSLKTILTPAAKSGHARLALLGL